ncbi:hypothetical protein Z968_03050 [Clostridium novyi A str. 4552]|uniref:Polymerase/histidinol phosphatase N-terminal domain-containing protein n=1 Tax=Clostridium novyi A str. 4552 TaxID=1444289 RepID=A0A0A0IAD2_CLONO|nr:PHP domain-containing protein [Clostridium novyi]KGM97513.1 hypothetical protein Z968_03050 [Clostridium novyi A str. 4552]
MQYKYVFHVHTEYSPDSDIKLNKLYKVLKKNHIYGIAITDHNTIEGAVKFKEKYGEDIHVIIGEEIMTTEGEIIGLFLKTGIKKGLMPEEVIKEINNQGGMVYIPHPFDKKRYKTCLKESVIRKKSFYIDFIEVFNGRCIEKQDVDEAILLNKSLNKVGIIGTDAHSYYELQFNHLIVKNKITKDNIKNEIKNLQVFNKKTNKIIHQYTKFIRIKKLIKEGKINEAFNLIYRKCKKRLCKISK